MRKKDYVVQISGKKKEWAYHVRMDEDTAEEMEEDGIEISEIIAIIPEWIVWLGLGYPYGKIDSFFRSIFR